MRANDGSRSGGEILVDQLIAHGVQHVFCVPGESYLAALDAFHDRNVNITVCRQEGGAAMMAEARRQGDRQARHLLRHARAGRHQCLARHPYREAGFDADDRVRRPDCARDARARGVPGGRLSRGVRHHDQMDDRDRRSGAHSGTRLARLLHRDERPAGAGGDRAAGGHADRARGRSECAVLRAGRDLARAHRHVAAAEAPLEREKAGRHRRRQPLVGECLRHHAAFRRTLSVAGDQFVPARASLRPDASVLRGRSRRRCQSESRRAHQGCRCAVADRRSFERDAEPGLYADRYSRHQADPRARPSRRGRARPRLSSASCDQCVADRVRRGARRLAGAGIAAMGGRHQDRACRLSRVQRKADAGAGQCQCRRDHGVAARAAHAGRHHLQWRRKFLRLDPSLLSLPQIRNAFWSDIRLDGLRRAGGGRR